MASTTVVLKRDRLRPGLVRHPWVYPEAVMRIDGSYENGDTVLVKGPGGEHVGEGFINDNSRLMVRIVTFQKGETLDEELLRARVRSAVALREEVLRLPERADAYRVVHSEGDGLPGLIVDRYADWLVMQCTSLAISQRLDSIVAELVAAYAPRGVIERGRAEGLRKKEGLGEGRGVVHGDEPPEKIEVVEDGARFLVNLQDGQKTGFFLDQRENRARAGALARGRRVLDACCFTGGFAIAAARGGAAQVQAFDASAKAIEIAEQNARLNGIDGLAPRRAEMFSELKRLREQDETFDMVVLDPPKFARNRGELQRALAGVLELNALGMRVLAPGGILITCTCSHHIDDGPFGDVLREAARRAKREVTVLEERGAGPDHPFHLHCPEGRYLRCWIMRVS